MVASTNYTRTLEEWRDVTSGLNLLQLAVVCANFQAVRVLYETYPRLLLSCRQVNPPLHIACYLGQTDIVHYLVETAATDIRVVGELSCVILRKIYLAHQDTLTEEAVAAEPRLTGDKVEVNIFSKSRAGGPEPRVGGQEDLPTSLSGSRMPSSGSGAATSGVSGSGCSPGDDVPRCEQCVSCESAESGIHTGTPYMFSVRSGNVECANYLLHLEFQHMLAKPNFLLDGLDRTPLHLAAYMGCPQHLALLLKLPLYRQVMNRAGPSGNTPFHVALISGNAPNLRVLLQAGVSVHVCSAHRSVLHCLYSEPASAQCLLPCTEVILQHACAPDLLRRQDENGNTALGYLACGLTRLGAPVDATPLAARGDGTEGGMDNPVLGCMERLLATGAPTLVCDGEGAPDHSLLVTLLHSRARNHCLAIRDHPQLVYRACKLFFRYGADPNVTARHHEHSPFATLLLQPLRQIRTCAWKLKFVELFLLNGADVDCIVGSPNCRQEGLGHSDRRWDIYPVMIALQERHPVRIVKVIYDFMSEKHVFRSLRLMRQKHIWHPMTWSLNGHRGEEDYKAEWRRLCRPEVRALRHSCKLVILRQLNRQGHLASHLPLPGALRNYINTSDF